MTTMEDKEVEPSESPEPMESMDSTEPETVETLLPETETLLPSVPPPPPFRREVLTVNDTGSITFERDAFGNLRCKGYRPHHVFKGKIVHMNEADAWRVTIKNTAKEKRDGTYNPDFPLGPYVCPSHNHWHTGHASENVGRKPSRMIQFQLVVEVVAKKVEKHRRLIQNYLRYCLKKS